MVEFAIVVWLFLMLVLGIIEFAYAIFQWSRVVDATRAGARTAIVSDLACGTADDLKAVCGDDRTNPADDVPIVCDGADGDIATDSPILENMNKLLLGIKADEVTVTYRCSTAGFDKRDTPIPEVTVETRWRHTFFFPGLLFGKDGWTVTLPPFAATRLGEDLHTEVIE
jgi:hypothetical protein